MIKDAADYVRRCDTCQRYADVHNAPPAELVSLTSSWPFMQWGIDLLGPFSPGRGGVKYLIVAVDYLTKWIEAEPLAHITAANCIRFFKKTILTRFGVPATVITDNGTQFTDKGFRTLMRDLGIRHHFTSVEHPQTNGQVESANKVILRGLKRKLNGAKGAWPEELPYVLWAYRTTPHSTTNETPFRMAYGTEAMLPVELSQATWRTLFRLSPEGNERASREELDLVEEVRDSARIAQAAVKARVSKRYNQKVVLREFEIGDLVLRRADVGNKNAREGKLAPNWEGPYRITMKTGTGAYHLETLSKEPIERTWNATKLRAYYS